MRSAVAMVCLLVAGAGSRALGEAPAALPPPGAFGESIDVRLVNVEVVVTDAAGRTVPDLSAAAFRLRIDGREVPIEFFSEVRDGEGLGPASTAEVGRPPRDGNERTPVPTSYLVFVDDVFSVHHHRNRVLDRIAEQMTRLSPGDRVAVASFDGGALALHAGWTGSPERIARALDEAARRPARGVWRRVEQASLRQGSGLADQVAQADASSAVEDAGDPFGGRSSEWARGLNPPLSFEERAYGMQLADRVGSVVEAAAGVMRALATAPGRKVVLLLSGGWPFSLESYIRAGEETSLGRELPEGEALFRPLTAAANLLGYTIYPVDVPGVQGDVAAADEAGPTGMDGWRREREVEGALEWIARETGGRAILNGRREDAFAVTAADTRSYYWLGFSPDWRRDGGRHDVRVEIRDRDRGLQARTRRDYVDLSRRAEVDMLLEGALLLGGLPRSATIPVAVGRPRRTRLGEVEVPLVLGLPVDAMTVLPDPEGFSARLELRIAGASKDGQRGKTSMIPLTLTAKRAPRAGGFIRYETTVKLRGKAERLVLATYDPWSGMVAVGEADMRAAARSKAVK